MVAVVVEFWIILAIAAVVIGAVIFIAITYTPGYSETDVRRRIAEDYASRVHDDSGCDD